MRISVQCPSCDHLLRVRESDVGRQARCPSCKQMILVPSAPPPPAQEALPLAVLDEPAPSDLGARIMEDLPVSPETAREPAPATTYGPRRAAAPVAPVVAAPVPAPFSPAMFSASPTPARKVTPTVARVYGLIFVVLGIIGLVLGPIGMILELRQIPRAMRTVRASTEEKATARRIVTVVIVVRTIFGMACAYFGYRVGKALRAGRKWSVIALCVIGGLGALVGLAITAVGAMAGPAALIGLIILGIVAALYAPPVVSGFRNWREFS